MKTPFLAVLLGLFCIYSSLASGPASPAQYDCNNDTQNGPPPCPATGVNPINAGTGGLYREVSDLRTFGAAPISFTRYFNSRTTTFSTQYSDFGAEQTWQHNWNYEMRQLSSKTSGFFDIKVRYPDGREYNFKATDNTGQQLAPSAGWGDRLYRWTGSTVGYTLVTPSGWEYYFQRYLSPKFDLNEVRDGQGFKWTITHDANHKIKRITNDFGKWLEITRATINGIESISQVATSDGRTVTFGYTAYTPTATSVLTSVTYPGAEVAAYTWTGASSATSGRPLLQTASDPLYGSAGARVKYVWNYNQIFNYGAGPYLITGSILEERNLDTNKVIVSFPNGTGTNPMILEGNGTQIGRKFENGRLTAFWDGEGRGTTRAYDAGGFGYLISTTEPNGGTTTYTRDYAGRLLSVTDPLLHTESWTYNAAGFLLTHTDKLGRVTTMTRNSANCVTRQDYPDGAYETWTYNSYGRPLSHRLQSGGTESFTYGADGNVATHTDAAGGYWQYAYDTAGRLVTATDPLLHATTFLYNWRGQKTRETHPGGSFAQFAYDSFGNLTSRTDELNHGWVYTYNEYQRLSSATDPLLHTTSYEYGREPGCSACAFGSTLSRITLPSGKKIEYAYDLSWKRTSMTVAPGTADEAITSYGYDAGGDLVSVTDPRGKGTVFTNDLLHRRLTSTDPLAHSTTWTYDAAGNLLTVKRADNSTTTNTYDARNRLLTTTNPLNQTTTYSYHPDGSLASLTDARANTYSFGVDALSRRTSMTYPGGSYEGWTYDLAGNMTQYRARNAATLTLTYDTRNRDTFDDWSDITPDVTKTYDNAGRLLTLANTNCALAYTYDAANQLLSETYGFGGAVGTKSVSYTYDADGNRASVTYPDASVVEYAYTGRNQVASISDGDPPPVAAFAYDAAGNRLTKTLENAVVSTYAYDDMGRLTSLTQENPTLNGDPLLASFAYDYDNVNRRSAETRDSSVTDSYTYDAADQLAEVSYANGVAVDYAYDAVGNRTSVSDNGNASPGPVSYTANALNQYTAITSFASPAYDAKGNLQSLGDWEYTYDAENRLIASESSNDQFSFLRDARHRCVRRVENGASRYLVYDGWDLIAEYDSSGALATKYIHGPKADELLAKINTAGAVYYLENALGSITSLTDANGNVVERYAYDVYGKASIYDDNGSSLAVSAYGNRFLFTGREWIEEANIYDYRNRSYSPELGRFLETDPVRVGADVNLYRYCSNSSIDIVDPLGFFGINDSGEEFTNLGELPDFDIPCPEGTEDGKRSGWGTGGTGGKNPNSSHPHGYGGGNESPPDGGGGSEGGVPYEQGIQPIFPEFDVMAIGSLAKLGAGFIAEGIANISSRMASGLGDLTRGEAAQIQSVVNQAGRPLNVVGSAARGARTANSDIDYVASPSSLKYFDSIQGNLPGLDSHGIIPGAPNPGIGPSMPFNPTLFP